jgi:DNA-binding helix-hairpin-helix protein with protein kinase domain
MPGDDLDEVAENIRILVREELEMGHRLVGHPEPVADCPVCEAHRSGVAPSESDPG